MLIAPISCQSFPRIAAAAMFSVIGCLPLAYGMQPFEIATTNLPPLSMDAAASSNPGALTEVVEELARRTHAPVQVKLVPWKRALLLPEHQSRLAIFPLTRSNERESKFRWLVKLYRESTIFTARANRTELDLQNIGALKQYSVAVVRGSSNEDQLRADGFTRLVDVTDVQSGIRMLNDGIVDLTYGSEAIYRGMPTAMGYVDAAFRYGPPVREFDIWLGGSLDFTVEDAAELQSAMKAMQRDGSYARILKKYKLVSRPPSH